MNDSSQIKKTVSKLAVISFLCACGGYLFIFVITSLAEGIGYLLGWILLIISFILGALAKSAIKKSEGKVKGLWLARISVCMSIAYLVFFLIFAFSHIH
jgi:hypothetical protein